MSAIQYKREPSSGNRAEHDESSSARSVDKSFGAALIELGITFAGLQSRPPIPGQCARCQSYRNPQASTAECPNVFCSKKCEQEFIRTALGDLTIEDCIRIHRRLQELVTGAGELAVTG
jgi:hypothetical protein